MLAIGLWRAGGVAVCVVLGTIILHLLVRRYVQHHPHPSHAVARWLHAHIALGLVAGGLMLLVVLVSLTRGFGARLVPHLVIHPASSALAAGGAAPPAFSLASYLPSVQNQQNTNACGAFAVAEVLYSERRLRHEQLGVGAWSPFFDYAYAAGGQNTATTLDQEAEAFGTHGVVPWDAQPQRGWPTQDIIAQALGFGTSYGYLFYSPAGEDGLKAIRGAIAAGHPVILLIRVNSDFWNGFGVAQTDNGGTFMGFYHFVVAYAYAGDRFWVRNSWGADFGQNGSIVFTQKAMLQSVIAAGVVLPGPVAWPLPQPEPQPPVSPRLVPPSVSSSGAPLIPFRPLPSTIVLVHAQALRRAPRADSARGPMVGVGQQLWTRGSQTPHWILAQTLDRLSSGWIFRSNARSP